MLSTHTYIPGVRHKGRECVVVPRGRTGLGVTAVAPRVPLQAVLQEPPRVDRRGQHEHEQHVEGEAGLWADERGSDVKSQLEAQEIVTSVTVKTAIMISFVLKSLISTCFHNFFAFHLNHSTLY